VRSAIMRGNDIFFPLIPPSLTSQEWRASARPPPHDYENENDNPLTGGILVGYSMDRGG